eukprot:CAMPEP_0119352268 /NCGR_PEP_ID=MMETSP1334-20130426/1554_1 /TAXON_ID=127549 /ORGANISM="Calcidiscus leptoporus, Strain RCC1130" /LENGTH=38 /DNA_ID= /DNA_START= /DNA_END= /DNA_ORIENTATION=
MVSFGPSATALPEEADPIASDGCTTAATGMLAVYCTGV